MPFSSQHAHLRRVIAVKLQVSEVRHGMSLHPTVWFSFLVDPIKWGPAEKDSIWGTQQEPRAVSIDAFWMDETEITNSKYKQFVFWVRDSIIRERLADPAYGGNEVFKIEEDREGNPIKPRLNWDKAHSVEKSQ